MPVQTAQKANSAYPCLNAVVCLPSRGKPTHPDCLPSHIFSPPSLRCTRARGGMEMVSSANLGAAGTEAPEVSNSSLACLPGLRLAPASCGASTWAFYTPLLPCVVGIFGIYCRDTCQDRVWELNSTTAQLQQRSRFLLGFTTAYDLLNRAVPLAWSAAQLDCRDATTGSTGSWPLESRKLCALQASPF